MTFNLFWDRPEPEVVEGVIRRTQADLVFLQEVTPRWRSTLAALQDEYPAIRCRLDERGRGNAMLSRWPLTRAWLVVALQGWHDGWQLQADTPIGPVQIVGVHLSPPLNRNRQFTLATLIGTGPLHRAEIEQFFTGVEPRLPLIVLGDFNEDGHGAASSWLRQQGLLNALESYDAFSPTWRFDDWQWVSARIDHVFHSKDLQCVEARVLDDDCSDHQPVVATFRRADNHDPQNWAVARMTERANHYPLTDAVSGGPQ